MQDAAKLRGRREYTELSTQKGGILFTTPTLRALSTAYREASTAYARKQSELVKEVITVVGTRGVRGSKACIVAN
jgi:DNA mismatch repair protein MSH2